jgi:hypothetical protein
MTKKKLLSPHSGLLVLSCLYDNHNAFSTEALVCYIALPNRGTFANVGICVLSFLATSPQMSMQHAAC